MKTKHIFITGAVLGFSAVGIGAFGAHALEAFLLENNRLETFNTAVRYQFYHTLAIFIIGLLNQNENHKKSLRLAALFMTLGVLFFSGSLYILCLTNSNFWGLVTPFGGVFMLIGWGMLFYFGIKKASTSTGY
jgi:uncharacterized membrane protein YgdD (TMEM256/DUF423 family)